MTSVPFVYYRPEEGAEIVPHTNCGVRYLDQDAGGNPAGSDDLSFQPVYHKGNADPDTWPCPCCPPPPPPPTDIPCTELNSLPSTLVFEVKGANGHVLISGPSTSSGFRFWLRDQTPVWQPGDNPPSRVVLECLSGRASGYWFEWGAGWRAMQGIHYPSGPVLFEFELTAPFGHHYPEADLFPVTIRVFRP